MPDSKPVRVIIDKYDLLNLQNGFDVELDVVGVVLVPANEQRRLGVACRTRTTGRHPGKVEKGEGAE